MAGFLVLKERPGGIVLIGDYRVKVLTCSPDGVVLSLSTSPTVDVMLSRGERISFGACAVTVTEHGPRACRLAIEAERSVRVLRVECEGRESA
jgi:hypothetical protein